MNKPLEKLKDPKILLLLIILLAVFFRFFMLNNVPPGLYPDVAVNATDAIEANETGEYKLFYANNNGREGLYINMLAVSFKVFGVGFWQLRFVGALIGALTVWGIYLLIKEFFGKNPAMLGSLFLATSFWAVNFSRIGFRAVLVPFIMVFSFYFLTKNISNSKKPMSDFILSGLLMGLGFHTYISFRIAPAIPILLFGYILFFNRDLFRKQWKNYIAFFVSIIIIALPVFLYLQSGAPETATRTGQVSILNPEVNKGNLIGTALKTTGLSLGMFNFFGDPNWRHNLPGLPALNFIVGPFFLIGISSLIRQFFSKKQKKFEKKIIPWLIGSWFFIMLIPAIMTEEGMPHSLRAIGSMIPSYIMAGYGAYLFFGWLSKKTSRHRGKIMAVVLGLIVLTDFSMYFAVWARRPEVSGQFTSDYVEMGNYLNEYPNNFHKYMIINRGHTILDDGFPVEAQTIKFVTYQKAEVTYLRKEDLENITLEKPALIIPIEHQKELIAKIEKTQNQILTISNVVTHNPDTSFVVYIIDE